MDSLNISDSGKEFVRASDVLKKAAGEETQLSEINLNWNDKYSENFHYLLKLADQARVPVNVYFAQLEPSHLSDVIFRYRYPRPEIGPAIPFDLKDGLVIGQVLTMPDEPSEYENARCMSLVSKPMQDFIQELRDALWTMGANKTSVKMPWDPLERQPSRTKTLRDGTLTLDGGGLPNLSEVFQTYEPSELHKIFHKIPEYDYDDRDVPPKFARENGWGRSYKLLVTGNSGTGKSLVAHLAHQVLYPEDHPDRHFAHLNCSALDAQNAEFDLFGAGPGTYTGVDYRVGELARAAYGTAFLDEFGDLQPGTAPILLTYLDNLMVKPRGMLPFFGFTHIIAATNRGLNARIRAGEFRNDLVQRFGRIITIPTLKERGADEIKTLIDMAAQNPYENPKERFRGKCSRPITKVSREALDALTNHTYEDGNVRELESIVHTAIQRARRRNSTVLDIKDLQLPAQSSYIPDADRYVIPVKELPSIEHVVDLKNHQDLDRIADRTSRPILHADNGTKAVIVNEICYRCSNG